MHTLYLYKDMSSRDLLQQRITLPNGDTVWQNSPLVSACLAGDIIVLDGIHRLRDDTLMALRRLIQDRELDLSDGTKLLRHDKYDELCKEALHTGQQLAGKILRIHPSFRLIATAEPPVSKASVRESGSEKPLTKAANSTDWLNSEVLNLFLYHTIEPLSTKYEHEILGKMFRLNSQHKRLFGLIEQLRNKSHDEAHLKHISKLFSLRKLIRISNQLEKYPNQDLATLVQNACLYKFMPQLNKQTLNDFLAENKLESMNEAKPIEDAQVSLQESVSKLRGLYGENNEALSLNEISKIPDTLFFENPLHTTVLNNLIRDFELGEHILLIGNQGINL